MSDIDIGQITEALNDKSDRDLRNVDNVAGADAVIEFQLPTAENDYTWYRKYASGWVEQGGIKYVSTLGTQVTLPIIMANSSYTLTLGNSDTSGDAALVAAGYRSKSTNSFILDTGYNNTFCAAYVNWEVKGMAANANSGTGFPLQPL